MSKKKALVQYLCVLVWHMLSQVLGHYLERKVLMTEMAIVLDYTKESYLVKDTKLRAIH